MVLQQIHILEEMSLASLSQKEQFLVGLLFFSPIDILVWNGRNSCKYFLDSIMAASISNNGGITNDKVGKMCCISWT